MAGAARDAIRPPSCGRPRRAPWIRSRHTEEDRIVLERRGGNMDGHHGIATLELDPTSDLIWRTCDGSRSVEDICQLFAEAYAGDAASTQRIAVDVRTALQRLLDEGFLVLDGGGETIEGPDGESPVVRHIIPGVELQWQLEIMRRFLFGVLRVEEAKEIESDLEAALGPEALARAKSADIDAASEGRDSNVIRYRESMKSPSFAACVNAIVAELEAAIPEGEGKLELSGNAIYLRGAYMGWHSNHSRADRRVYCSWCERPDANFFRYEHPATGEIVTDWEQPGWNIKTFAIPPRPARFWHCIGAASLRLAIGFRFPGQPASADA